MDNYDNDEGEGMQFFSNLNERDMDASLDAGEVEEDETRPPELKALRIFVVKTYLGGAPIPLALNDDNWLQAASCGRDDVREIWGGNTMSNPHRHAW